MKLKESERIDDLQCQNLKIIQDKSGFCYGMDSVILSEFAREIRENDKVIDLGTGTGILGFLVYGKRKVVNITGVEVQSEVAKMAVRSIKLNHLENIFQIINEDLRYIVEKKLVEKNSFDIVITNPPYKENHTGIVNKNEKKLISRHEITGTIEDFISVSAQVLKDRGILYMIHRPERLVDIFCILRNYKLEPKEIRFVAPSAGMSPNLVLIKAVKGGRKFLKIQKQLYIYEKNGEYSEEIQKLYQR